MVWFIFTRRKIQVNSKWIKIHHYKLRENIQFAYWPDVSGAGASKVNTEIRCCALDYRRTENLCSFHSYLFVCPDLCTSTVLPGGWFGSRLNHVNTINELDWSSCGTTPRPPPLQGFSVIVLLCNYWVHTLTNETHHGGKRTRVQHRRCENTLNGKVQYMHCIVLLYVIWYCNWFVYMYVYIFTCVQILFVLQIWCCLNESAISLKLCGVYKESQWNS